MQRPADEETTARQADEDLGRLDNVDELVDAVRVTQIEWRAEQSRQLERQILSVRHASSTEELAPATVSRRNRVRPILRSRRRESHGTRPGHSRTARARARAGPSDDDGPSSSEPPARRHLAAAPKPKAIVNFGCSRCETCGGVLLWSAGELVCPDKRCPRYGRAA